MSDDRDAAIDARLRDVPVPPGLAGRVAAASLFDDAAIDGLLARVSVPAGLGDRVRQTCAASRRGLLDTPPPQAAAAVARSRRPAAALGAGVRWLFSTAADLGAVAAALGIVAAMFFAGMELSRRLDSPAAPPVGAAAAATNRDRSGKASAALEDRRGMAGGAAVAAGSPGASPGNAGGPGHATRAAAGPTAGPFGARPLVATGSPRGMPLPPGAAQVEPPGADARRQAADRPAEAGVVAATKNASSPAGAGVPDVSVRASPAIADWSSSGRVVGARGMRLVTLPTVSRAVPRAKGFDMVFEMTHGESPFVDPGASQVLAVDRPPLSLRTDAFDVLRDAAAREGSAASRRGRGPSRRGVAAGGPLGGPAGGLAVQELVAALPPPWGTAAGRQTAVATRGGGRVVVSGVRSLRPEPGSTLVEICAAPAEIPAGDTPIDTLLVLDQSAATSLPLSWVWLCRGLGRIAAAMGPDDRLSVVIAGERPRLAALRADAAAVGTLIAELETEPASGASDVDAAVRLAATVARREGPPRRIVVAARAESLERCRGEGRAALVAWRAGAEAAAESPPVHFLSVDPQERPPDASFRTEPPAGSGRVAADAIAIARAMLAEVSGRPTLAASGCRLTVSFDPRAVGSYRIVGYRQTAADAVSSAGPTPVDLHAGESVRVVYEVVPRAGAAGGARDAVSATFVWTPPGSDAEERRRAEWGFDGGAGGGRGTAARRDVPPPAGCELLLAVACGELASGSPHIEPRRQSLAAIASFVARWKARGDVTPTGALLIDALQRLGLPQDAAVQ